MVNQLATAHERDMIKRNSKVHLVANFPDVSEISDTIEMRKPIIKIQILEQEDGGTGLNVKEIFLEGLKETNNPIDF